MNSRPSPIESYASNVLLPEFRLWNKIKEKRNIISFYLEVTGRCNNNCRHCYINLPANDIQAKKRELSFEEIKNMVDQAVELGALWCLITGGEPLLREDFFDIYLYLKKKGLITSVFTNARLIRKEHIKFFKKYPPRDIEVTVYGITKETYEKVTRRNGSFMQFMQGLELLLKNNIKVRFKAMALRSNVRELPEIAKFCQMRTKDYFRFDPFVRLRFDRNSKRNAEIKSERLTSDEIVAIERADPERFGVLEKNCDILILPEYSHNNSRHLFRCGAGYGTFGISYDGFFRACAVLCHPGYVYDLKKGTLVEAWYKFIPRVLSIRSDRREFMDRCSKCELVNLCLWCPAYAYLETGELDKPVDYFCELAHARREMLKKVISSKSPAKSSRL